MPFEGVLGAAQLFVGCLYSVCRQGLTSSTYSWTKIVSNLSLDQQLLKHFDDANIVFGRTLHISTSPFLQYHSFCYVTGYLAIGNVTLIAYNHDGDPVTAGIQNLRTQRRKYCWLRSIHSWIRNNFQHCTIRQITSKDGKFGSCLFASTSIFRNENICWKL